MKRFVSLLIGLFFAFFIGSFGRPEILTRFYAMKDTKTIRRGILWVFVLVGVAHFLVFLLAMGIRALTPNLPNSDMAMPAIASAYMPGIIGSVLLAAVVAAMMSTVDSILHQEELHRFLQVKSYPADCRLALAVTDSVSDQPGR